MSSSSYSALDSLRAVPEKGRKETNTNLFHRIFSHIGNADERISATLKELKAKVLDHHLPKELLAAELRKSFGSPVMWARIAARGVSQKDIDFVRKFVPGTLPGHYNILKAKVFRFDFCFDSCSCFFILFLFLFFFSFLFFSFFWFCFVSC